MNRMPCKHSLILGSLQQPSKMKAWFRAVAHPFTPSNVRFELVREIGDRMFPPTATGRHRVELGRSRTSRSGQVWSLTTRSNFNDK